MRRWVVTLLPAVQRLRCVGFFPSLGVVLKVRARGLTEDEQRRLVVDLLADVRSSEVHASPPLGVGDNERCSSACSVFAGIEAVGTQGVDDDGIFVSALPVLMAATASSAACKRWGNVFPLFAARFRMPAHALGDRK
jgi:hypothetical protein